MHRRWSVLLLVLALTSCSSGTSALDACVQHSVEEGLDAATAEAACAEVVGDG